MGEKFLDQSSFPSEKYLAPRERRKKVKRFRSANARADGKGTWKPQERNGCFHIFFRLVARHFDPDSGLLLVRLLLWSKLPHMWTVGPSVARTFILHDDDDSYS